MDFLIIPILAAPLVFFYFYNKRRASLVEKKKMSEKDPIVKCGNRKPHELALGWAAGEEDGAIDPILQLKGVPQKHRDTHFYVVGGSGSGKTKFLESLILQDIEDGKGFAVIDPHGDLTEDVKGYLFLAAESRGSAFLAEKVVLIDPTDEKGVAAFNPLEKGEGISPAEQAAELVQVFKKIWVDSWGPRMEEIMRNAFIVLIENDRTLADFSRLLTDDEFRARALERTKHAVCRDFFSKRYDAWSKAMRNLYIESTLNKVNAFLSDDRIRAMLSFPRSSFDLREIMDSGKILLVKLDKGRLKGAADLLGALLVTKIQMAAFSRTNLPPEKRKRFYLYIDEFQNFATESFLDALAEARKYRLALILAHQNLTQVPKTLRDSLLANCGLHAYFRLGRTDAQLLAKEALTTLYDKKTGWEDYIQILQELPPRQFAAKNKIDGGAVILSSLKVDPPHELAGAEEPSFRETVAAAHVGGAYLRQCPPEKEKKEEQKGEWDEGNPEFFREKRPGS